MPARTGVASPSTVTPRCDGCLSPRAESASRPRADVHLAHPPYARWACPRKGAHHAQGRYGHRQPSDRGALLAAAITGPSISWSHSSPSGRPARRDDERRSDPLIPRRAWPRVARPRDCQCASDPACARLHRLACAPDPDPSPRLCARRSRRRGRSAGRASGTGWWWPVRLRRSSKPWTAPTSKLSNDATLQGWYGLSNFTHLFGDLGMFAIATVMAGHR